MAKQLKFTFKDKEYVLEFTRRTVTEMEKKGFVAAEVENKPMSTLPALFEGAFLAHHGFEKKEVINGVENWIKKLGLSVYQDDQPCKGKKFAMVMDESIAINGQKLLLALASPSEHQDRPVKHEDVTVLNMTVGDVYKRQHVVNTRVAIS